MNVITNVCTGQFSTVTFFAKRRKKIAIKKLLGEPGVIRRSMNLNELAESYLLSMNNDQKNLYIEFVLLSESGQKVKLFAHNKNTNPISVEFIGLTLKANFTTYDGVPSLGEIESVEVTDSGFSFEGDMGFIKVVADTWYIENAL